MEVMATENSSTSFSLEIIGGKKEIKKIKVQIWLTDNPNFRKLKKFNIALHPTRDLNLDVAQVEYEGM